MSIGKVLSALVTLALIAGIFWYRSNQADKVDAHADLTHEHCATQLAAIPGSDQLDAFLEEHEPVAHRRAFDAAYEPGARRRSPRFEPKVYCDTYFQYLINTARRLEKRDLDQPLREAQIKAEKALPQS